MTKVGEYQGQYFLRREGLPIGNWRFIGAKLKEIGKLYGISESGVTRSCGRFESRLEKDKHLEEELLQMMEDLK